MSYLNDVKNAMLSLRPFSSSPSPVKGSNFPSNSCRICHDTLPQESSFQSPLLSNAITPYSLGPISFGSTLCSQKEFFLKLSSTRYLVL